MKEIHALTFGVVLIENALSVHSHIKHADTDAHRSKADQNKDQFSAKTDQAKARSRDNSSNA